MREYTTEEVDGIVRTELQSDLESTLREGARPMLQVALQVEVAEYIPNEARQADRTGLHVFQPALSVLRHGVIPYSAAEPEDLRALIFRTSKLMRSVLNSFQEEQKLQVERDLAAAYRARDFNRGDRLSRSLNRLEAEIEELYAATSTASACRLSHP